MSSRARCGPRAVSLTHLGHQVSSHSTKDVHWLFGGLRSRELEISPSVHLSYEHDNLKNRKRTNFSFVVWLKLRCKKSIKKWVDT